MSDKNSESSKLWEIILTAMITAAIPLLLGYLLKSPRIGVLLLIVFLVGAFLLIHFRRIRVASDVPGKMVTTYRYSQSLRYFAGIALIIVLMLGNILFLFPRSNQLIQVALGLTPTPTLTTTSTPTPFTPSATNTEMPLPTNTATLSPSPTMVLAPTPTISPLAKYQFTQGCIPFGWTTFTGSVLTSGQECLDSKNLLIVGNDNGFDANITTTQGDYFDGIIMPIPDRVKTIRFDVTVDNVVYPTTSMPNAFFFGFIDKDNISLTNEFGDFVVYKMISYQGTKYAPVVFGSNPIRTGYPQLFEFKPGEKQNVIVSLTPTSYLYQIDGRIDPTVKQLLYRSYGKYFAFGFQAIRGGAFHVKIENFKMEE